MKHAQRLSTVLSKFRMLASNQALLNSNLLNTDRLAHAKEQLELAAALVGTSGDVCPTDERDFYKSLITAVVDIDAAQRPEIDPNEGWVRMHNSHLDNPEDTEIVIDTQLMTMFLAKDQAAITDWYYKPRKTNLLGSLGLLPSFYIRPVDQKPNTVWPCSTLFSTTQHTPGLVTIRVSSIFPNQTSIICDYNFKAGIGAFRTNSTTGFSLDFWVESTTQDNPTIEFGNTFLLPSRSSLGVTAQVLTAVGGVSPEILTLDSDTLMTDHEGGLFGARLIDGLASLVIDVRTAKKISELSLHHDFIGDSYNGLNVVFRFNPRDTLGYENRNSIYISI